MTTQKIKIIKDSAFLNIALIIGQVLAVLQSFIIMRFLDPAMYGLWLGLMILLTYSSYVHLGITYGMVMRLLYYKGQGNELRVEQIQDTAYTVWSALSLLFSIGVFFYALLTSGITSFEKWGLFIISLIIVFEQQMAFLTQWQTSFLKDFKMVSISNISRAILSFVLLVPLAFFFNVKGVMLGSLAVSGIMMIYWWVKTTYRPHLRLSTNVLWEMLRIGFPIMLVVLAGVLIQSIDRLVILKFIGAVSLGFYGITALGGNSVYGLLAQAGSSIGPHIIDDFGRSNDSPKSLQKYITKPTLVFSYFSVFLISALLIFVPFIVEWVLPRYIPGIMAFYIMVPGYFFLSITLTANNILNVILIAKKRQSLIVYIQILAIIIEVALSILFIHWGWDIEGVALASTITSAFYGMAILYFALYYVIPNKKEQINFIGSVLLPFLYALVSLPLVIWLGKHLIPGSNAGRFALQGATCILIFIPLFFYLNKKTNISKDVGPVVKGFLKKIGISQSLKNNNEISQGDVMSKEDTLKK